MIIHQATQADFKAVVAFYEDVIARTPGIAQYAQWHKDKHPTTEGLRSFIESKNLYVYKEDESIVGAFVLTMYQTKEYRGVDWRLQVADDEAAVIQTLATSPDRQGAGIGAKMVHEAARLARDHGMKVLRLDATATNTPVHKLYERLGFEWRGQQHLYAENNGWLDFYFFELVL